MFEQGFNYCNSTVKDMVDFFDICVENLDTKKDMKKESSNSTNKAKKKKRKYEDKYDYSKASAEESSCDTKQGLERVNQQTKK